MVGCSAPHKFIAHHAQVKEQQRSLCRARQSSLNICLCFQSQIHGVLPSVLRMTQQKYPLLSFDLQGNDVGLGRFQDTLR